MGGRRIGIEIVRADLKIHQPESVKGTRLHDRHVFGRLQAGTSNDRSGTRSYIGFATSYLVTNDVPKLPVVKAFQQPKCIPTTNKDRVRFLDYTLWMGNIMDRDEVAPHLIEP